MKLKLNLQKQHHLEGCPSEVELEFRNAGFYGGRKSEKARKTP